MGEKGYHLMDVITELSSTTEQKSTTDNLVNRGSYTFNEVKDAPKFADVVFTSRLP